MPILSSCCFCFDLKAGTKIIGILSLIAGLINTLTFAGLTVMFVFIGIGTDTAKSLNRQLQPTYDDADDDYVDVREEQGKTILEIMMDHISTVSIIVYVMLAVCILIVITSSMLIHGVKRNRRGLLVPYIFQEIITIIVIASLNIWTLVIFGAQATIIGTVLGLLTCVLVHVYFVLVVVSQYQALGLIRMHEEMSMK